MKKTKVVLINPPISIEDIYGKYSKLASFQPPVGLCHLAAYLIKNGYKVNIIDAPVLRLSIIKIIDNLMKDTPDLVGIYTNTTNYHSVSLLAAEIKKANHFQKIVAGGPHATALPFETLKETVIDYCVVGEGEETLLELVQNIDMGTEELEKIDGLAFKAIDKEIILNKPRKPIKNLDDLPFPAVNLLPPLSNYRPYLLHYKRMPYMSLTTTRGCPYKCVFCNTPFGKSLRFHSSEYVVSYMEFLSKVFGVKEFFFSDDTFTSNEERVFQICHLIRKKELDVSWYANTHASIKNDNLFKEMKRSGCWIVAVGAESGSPEILRLLKKGINLDHIKNTCKLVLNAGLRLKVFFILGNPGETLETIERTIKFAKSLKADFPVFSLMTPYPGTELWETAEKFGTCDRSNFQKLILSSSDPIFVPFGLSKDILLKEQKKAFRKTYFNLTMIKRHLFSLRSMAEIKVILQAFFSFLKIQIQK